LLLFLFFTSPLFFLIFFFIIKKGPCITMRAWLTHIRVHKVCSYGLHERTTIVLFSMAWSLLIKGFSKIDAISRVLPSPSGIWVQCSDSIINIVIATLSLKLYLLVSTRDRWGLLWLQC
jgi:hypothetical protein